MAIFNWLANLRRTTSGRKYIPEIDGLRFLAIVAVLLFHSRNNYLHRIDGVPYHAVGGARHDGGLLFDVLGTGHYGVNLFFAISGFILVLPFATHYRQQTAPPSIKNYYLRRLTRIEPPYLVALTIYFIFKTMFYQDAGLFKNFLASIFYVHGAVYNNVSSVLNVAWSLEVEIQFYLLAPVLARVFQIASDHLRLLTLLTLTISAAVLADSRGAEGTLPGYFLIDYCQYFFVGFLVAELYLSDLLKHPSLSRVADLFTAAGLIGLVCAALLGKHVAYTTPSCIFLLMVGGLSGRVSRRLLSINSVVIVGGACYSIYLYHMLIIAACSPVLAKAIAPLPEVLAQPIYVFSLAIIATLPCMIAFAVIEKPTMNPRWVSAVMSRFNKNKADTETA